MKVKPLSPHVGAEVGDVDLTRPLAPEQVNGIKEALARHGVIFFRDQPIDLEMHRRFAMHFGELHIHVGGEGTASKPDEKYPEARRQHFDANSKRVSGEVWHTDQSCAAIQAARELYSCAETEFGDGWFAVDVSGETLSKTARDHWRRRETFPSGIRGRSP